MIGAAGSGRLRSGTLKIPDGFWGDLVTTFITLPGTEYRLTWDLQYDSRSTDGYELPDEMRNIQLYFGTTE